MPRIDILRCFASATDGCGEPSPAMMMAERRSRKVGALPDKARMVLNAALHCLPDELPEHTSRHAMGVSLGTQCGAMDAAQACLTTMHTEGFGAVTPSWYATGLPNATAAIVAAIHDLQGPNLTLMGYTGGIEAITMACRQLMAGRADAMLAGGFDAVTPVMQTLARTCPDLADTTLQAGVGLLWLTQAGNAPAPLASIVGWSQGWLPREALVRGNHGDLVAQACSMLDTPAGGITTHLVTPGRHDQLAATAVQRLVNDIVEAGQPGLHALLVQGLTPNACCLLIDKPLFH
jgi:3-oxoacyl-[acyl-carrier-protein] synthase II